jgi:hypothetical protein
MRAVRAVGAWVRYWWWTWRERGAGIGKRISIRAGCNFAAVEGLEMRSWPYCWKLAVMHYHRGRYVRDG